MFKQIVQNYLPNDWSYMSSYGSNDFELVDIPSGSLMYTRLQRAVVGPFNLATGRIVRVQNPYLYAEFLLKQEEYGTRGLAAVHELYHDTAESKISSIVSSNLDWRLANRVKFGQGVSFSPSPTYANQESSRNNGTSRAMIIADVLVGRSEQVSSSRQLPSDGCDTTIGNCGQVYVKFYDNEFYPKYVVYYTSRPHVQRYRRTFW